MSYWLHSDVEGCKLGILVNSETGLGYMIALQ